MTSKPDFTVMVLLLVFMQLTRDLFAIAKFLLYKGVSDVVSMYHVRRRMNGRGQMKKEMRRRVNIN